MNTKKSHYSTRKPSLFPKSFLFVVFIASWLYFPAYTNAQSVHDTLTLNGIALRSQLSREYYIGALYVPTPSRSSPIIVRMNGPKRLEIRVTSERWTPRRFGQMWNQALSVNNSPEVLKEITKEVIEFTRLIKKPLTTGDTIQIDYDPDKGSVIKLNGRRIKFIKSTVFFDAILKCWIGSRPPSSEFKKGILSITPFDKNLYARYQSLGVSKKPVAKTTEPNKPKSNRPALPKVQKPIANTPQPAANTVISATTVLSAAERAAKEAAEQQAKLERAERRAEQRRLAEERRKEQVRQRQLREAEVARQQEFARQQAIARQQELARQEAEQRERQKQEELAKQAKIEAEKKLALEQQKAAERKRILDKIKGIKNSYHAKVLRDIYRKVVYPERALERNQEGTVILLAKINGKGQLKSLTIQEESNYTLLDKAAKTAVKNAQPFNKPSKTILIDGFVELKIPIRFRLP